MWPNVVVTVSALVLMLGQAAGQQFVGTWSMNLRRQT
jgi:hypothetical protein